MNLYLDDNITDRRLMVQLRQAGHDVVIPTEAGQDGASDATHWAYAIHQNRILLTQDVNDFTDLHDLILAAGGHHPGLLLLYTENDPTRDMTVRSIVVAIAKLKTAEMPLVDQLYLLNHWR